MSILSFLYLRPMYIEKLHCTIQVFKRHLLSVPSEQRQSQLHTMNHIIQMYIKKLNRTKQLFERHLPSVPFQQKQSWLFTLNLKILMAWFMVYNWDCCCWNGINGRCHLNNCFVWCNFLRYNGLNSPWVLGLFYITSLISEAGSTMACWGILFLNDN